MLAPDPTTERDDVRLVTLGAGTGQATVVRAVRDTTIPWVAVVGTTDDGGHSGVLRRELGIPQVGDYKNCLAAAAPEGLWRDLFAHRFDSGGLEGASLGNLMIAAAIEQSDGFVDAAIEILPALGIRGAILPVSNRSADVCAETAGGTIIRGEWEIIRRAPELGALHRVFHEPALPAHPRVLAEIARATHVLIAPGSLFTGLLSVLVAEGLPAALRATSASIGLVLNLSTQPGQTDGLDEQGHVDAIERHVGRPVDVIFRHSGDLPTAMIEAMAAHGMDRPARLEARAGTRVFDRPLVIASEWTRAADRAAAEGMDVGYHFVRHDAGLLKAAILEWVLDHETTRRLDATSQR